MGDQGHIVLERFSLRKNLLFCTFLSILMGLLSAIILFAVSIFTNSISKSNFSSIYAGVSYNQSIGSMFISSVESFFIFGIISFIVSFVILLAYNLFSKFGGKLQFDLTEIQAN